MGEQEYSEKYNDILSTGKELFWKHGIKRVSVEEICREAGVSKMTYYRFFSNKNDLAETILKNMFDENMEKYCELMDSDIPFEEKVKKQILLKFEGTKDFSPELVKDIFNNPGSELYNYWKSRADEALKLVMDYYSKAQKSGDIRKDIKPEFIIYFSNKMFEMISDENYMKMYESTQDAVMEMINMFFYGILPHETKHTTLWIDSK